MTKSLNGFEFEEIGNIMVSQQRIIYIASLSKRSWLL